MPLNDLQNYLPESIFRELHTVADRVTEIRIRADKPVQLICSAERRFIDTVLSTQEIRNLAVKMMDHSYYAHEPELAQGYFTMANGCRVGVGGSFSQTSERSISLSSIGSLCIRIARPVHNCAAALIREMTKENCLKSALVISRPGMGKTTLLRDAARLLSAKGYIVGIADERSEIAACRNGVPSMDVGPTTDVIDGCPKALAIEYLIRAMAPQIIITDEIGNTGDILAIRDAARRGVALLASAHAESFEQFESGPMAELAAEDLFPVAALLSGAPGQITEIRRTGASSCI